MDRVFVTILPLVILIKSEDTQVRKTEWLIRMGPPVHIGNPSEPNKFALKSSLSLDIFNISP